MLSMAGFFYAGSLGLLFERRDDSMRVSPVCLSVVFVVFVVIANGCVTDQAHRYYASERFPPRPLVEVEVLSEAPSRAHEVIADFQARGASAEYMRNKAAEIGADAVIIGRYGGFRAKTDEWASEDKHADTYWKFSRITGTAIRYKR